MFAQAEMRLLGTASSLLTSRCDAILQLVHIRTVRGLTDVVQRLGPAAFNHRKVDRLPTFLGDAVGGMLSVAVPDVRLHFTEQAMLQHRAGVIS